MKEYFIQKEKLPGIMLTYVNYTLRAKTVTVGDKLGAVSNLAWLGACPLLFSILSGF